MIVGDVHGKPMLDALDAEPERWDLSTVRVLSSTGSMWSAPVKERLSAYLPRALLVDTLGVDRGAGDRVVGDPCPAKPRPRRSSRSPTTRACSPRTSDGSTPGSGERGLLARRGATSLGYYKDEAKTATTFRIIDGQRWLVPGDWATVEADGTITLLGRGSGTINTGGEKVFPEEVEEALKASTRRARRRRGRRARRALRRDRVCSGRARARARARGSTSSWPWRGRGWPATRPLAVCSSFRRSSARRTARSTGRVAGTCKCSKRRHDRPDRMSPPRPPVEVAPRKRLTQADVVAASAAGRGPRRRSTHHGPRGDRARCDCDGALRPRE